MKHNTSFLVLKPDGVRAVRYEKLSCIFFQYGISIDSFRTLRFTESIIRYLWPHRNNNNISTQIFTKLLTSSNSYLIDISTERKANFPLASFIVKNKGSCIPGLEDKNSIRSKLGAWPYHFNYIHAPDNHSMMIDEYAKLRRISSKKELKEDLKLGACKFDLQRSREKSAKLITCDLLANKIINGKAISQSEFYTAWKIWSITQDLDIYLIANLYLEEEFF